MIFDIFIKPLPKEAADVHANMVPKLQNAESQIKMSQSVPASGEMVGLWRKLRTMQSPPAENCAEYLISYFWSSPLLCLIFHRISLPIKAIATTVGASGQFSSTAKKIPKKYATRTVKIPIINSTIFSPFSSNYK